MQDRVENGGEKRLTFFQNIAHYYKNAMKLYFESFLVQIYVVSCWSNAKYCPPAIQSKPNIIVFLIKIIWKNFGPGPGPGE